MTFHRPGRIIPTEALPLLETPRSQLIQGMSGHLRMLKQMGRQLAYRLGAMELVRQLNKNRVRILMFHRFPREHKASFDRQCAFLAENYNVVSLVEAAERLQAKQPVPNMAVLTIDDGYADVYDVACPILQRYRLPATLFVTTGFIDRTCWMPGDRVRHHFAHTSAATVEVTDDAGKVHSFRTKGAQASDGFRALLKRVPERTKRRMLSELDGDLPVPDAANMSEDYRPCTWEQLQELADGGLSIGAHTMTHPILSRVETASETEQEIVGSKARIEEKLQRAVETFAYPNGTNEDINDVSVNCARVNFRAAVTAVAGLNAPESDVHELLRLPCEPDLSVPQLARSLAGPVRRSRPSLHLVAQPSY